MSTPPFAHWDDVKPRTVEVGHIRGRWRDLGRAAGSRGIGIQRIEVAEGGFSTPAHVHPNDDEFFYVLGGTGLLWQDGATVEVRCGDCVVHPGGRGAHTLCGGEGGLDVLAFGARLGPGLTHLPRARVSWARPVWVDAGAGPSPFEREAEIGPPDLTEPVAERPANVLRPDDAEAAFGGSVRLVGLTGGARTSGFNHVRLPPGGSGAPPHCHSLEEELFVALDGEATLLLYPPATVGGDPEQHPLRRGHVVARPPGTGVAHAFRAGPDGFTYLAYGTREPNDMTYYPRSGKVLIRGLDVVFRPEQLPFEQGEEDSS